MTKTVTTGKATDLITFTRSTTGTYLGSDGLLKTANTNEPRIEYDADGNLKGLLIEEQRNNLLSYSEAFDNVYWSKENTNVISDQTVAPDGTNSADKIIEANTTNTFHFVTRSMSVSAGAKTFSAYFKKGERNFAALTLRVDSGSKRLAVIFDLTNGTVADTLTFGSPTQTNSTIENAGNGWYRCSITAYHSTGNVIALLSPQDDGNGGGTINMDYAGTVGYGVYAWGAQLEEGLFPTSYIPTSGSTVTRNADVATINLSEFEYNHTESTILVEGEKTARNTSSTGVFTFVAIHDGGSSDRVLLYYNNTILRGQVKSANNVVAQLTSEVAEGGKLGLAYKENDVAFTSNGGTVNTDTSAAMPSGLNTLAIGGYSYSTGQNLNGHIKSVKYYPVRLTDNQLKALTQ